VPGVRQADAAAHRPVRAVLRLRRLPDLQGHPQPAAAADVPHAGGEVRPFRSPTDPDGSYLERRTSRYGKPFVGSTGYPDDEFAVWSLPIATPCSECGAPLRPPPRNRKEPVAVCTHPEVNHVFALDDFDVPAVATWTVVEGVEAFDPELGGEPLETEEIPPAIPMALTGERKPPAKKKGAAKKGAKGTATKATAKKRPRRRPTAKKATAKKATAKKATARKTSGKKRTSQR
jgi:DNA topoisomerase I